MQKYYDVVIIGGGVAGLSAAIYLSRAGRKTLLIEKESYGGQIVTTELVENYPGIKSINGRKLGEEMKEQAFRYGTEFLKAEVKEIKTDGDNKTVKTDSGEFASKGLIYAAGARARRIGFPGERRLTGRGVSYCSVCDGELFRGKELFVAGGGYAAAEESIFLTEYAAHVNLLVRGEKMRCDESLVSKLKENGKITIYLNTEIAEIKGEDKPESITFINRKSGETNIFTSGERGFGVFIFAGYEPQSKLLKEYAEIDEEGYILTSEECETKTPGIYAAGDVRKKKLRQLVTAAADGAIAAGSMLDYLGK